LYRTFLQLESDGTVKAILSSSKVPGTGPKLPSDFIEVTSETLPPGKNAWDELLLSQYKRAGKVFTDPPPNADDVRRNGLKGKDIATWNTQDKDDAQRLL